MDKATEDAIRAAIKDHWRTKTDAQLATLLHTTTDHVSELRSEMGLKSNETLKEYARRYLLEMPEAEKKRFMERLPADLIWKMAEGSPATSGTLEVSNEPIIIDITHQLLKVYGPTAARVIDQVPDDSEGGRLAAGTSE